MIINKWRTTKERIFVPNSTLLSVLNQFPGCWGCKDTNSNYVYASESFSQLVGLNNHSECVGRYRTLISLALQLSVLSIFGGKTNTSWKLDKL